MSSKRYTVVFDVEGGTYIAQVVAMSPSSALACWVRAVRDEAWVRAHFGSAGRFESWWGRATEVFGEPVPLEGLTGVWSLSVLGDVDEPEVRADCLVIEGGAA
jgi:hypothetical protein